MAPGGGLEVKPCATEHSLQALGRPLQSSTSRIFRRIGSRGEMSDTHQQLIAKLAEELGQATAQHLVSRLVEAVATPSQVEGVVLLLDELTEVSQKVVRAAIESFPDLQQRGRLSDAVAWLDLGIALAESSGAIG